MSTDHEAERWIALLGLEPHPEGGFFRETWRSPLAIGGLVTWRDSLALVPVPPDLAADPVAAARVVGVQGCLWTEYITTGDQALRMLFPRLCAVAEVGWSGPGTDPDEFAGRLATHLGRLDALGLPHGPVDD